MAGQPTSISHSEGFLPQHTSPHHSEGRQPRGIHGRKISSLNKVSQSGRSMVEMLGVLAVIGVLSIGGITAYRTAMANHTANEILNELNIISMNVSSYIRKKLMIYAPNLDRTVTHLCPHIQHFIFTII